MEGVATLYNAGQASLTNPIWNSKLDGGYLVDGYPSTPTSLGPGPRIPSSTTVVQQPTSPGSTITGDSFSTAVSDIPTETAGRIPQSISIPVTASAPTTYLSLVSTVATASPTSTTNGKENPGGMNSSVIAAISSVGGGLLLIAIGLAYFYYCWRSKRDTDKGAHQAANQYFSRLTPSLVSLDKWNDRHDHHPPSSSDPADVFSITSLPVYANGSIVVVMANVPGVYVATTSHESLSDGELSYSENDQVYVLSRPGRHGWCRAKIGEAEGWIEAVNLEPLDI
ncbi:hypothetical protein BDR26DRAFT_857194 [Obelidium mucronatum]|nr:hypothetical protein BDR26DRAFT_857194 [Obelidium mucronatum]